MANNKVLTGAIALIKVQGVVVGLMRSVRVQESFRRTPVRGIGTILPSEQAVTEWDGTLTCDFMEISFFNTGIRNAITREIGNIGSQVDSGNTSFEDELILNSDGVQVDIFKKIKDVINSDGTIKPKLVPHVTIKRCLIENESLDISEGGISGHNQSFKYLDPITLVG